MKEHDNDAQAKAAHVAAAAPIEAMKKAVAARAEVEKRIAEYHTKESNKDQDGNESVVATTSDGAASDVEDFEFSSLMGKFSSGSGTKPGSSKRAKAQGSVPDQQRKRQSQSGEPAPNVAPESTPHSSEGDAAPKGKRQQATPAPPASKRLQSDTAGAKEKAMALCESKRAAFTDEILWDTKIKARQIQQLSKTIEENVAKMMGDDANMDYVSMLVDFPDLVQRKFDLFAEIRKHPAEHVKAMSEDDLRLLSSTKPELLQKIIMHISTSLLKDVEDRWVGPAGLQVFASCDA